MPALAKAIRGLFGYTLWADGEILDALSEVPADDLFRDTGSSFGSVLGTMAHILGAEQIWLSRLLGAPLDHLPGIGNYPDVASLRAGFEDLRPQLEFYLASIKEEDLETEFHWRSIAGEARSAPLRQVLLHFVNHATYHRGQVVSQLRQLGRAAPSTDLVYWKGAL